AMVLLAVGHDRLRFAELVEHDDELAALDLLHLTGQKLPDASRELVANAGAFSFTDSLDDALLGSLYRGSAEGGEIDWLFELIADLEAFIEHAGVLELDLADARMF